MLMTIVAVVSALSLSEIGSAPIKETPPSDCAACYNGYNITYRYSFHAHYECPEVPDGQWIDRWLDMYRDQPWGGHQYGTGRAVALNTRPAGGYVGRSSKAESCSLS